MNVKNAAIIFVGATLDAKIIKKCIAGSHGGGETVLSFFFFFICIILKVVYVTGM